MSIRTMNRPLILVGAALLVLLGATLLFGGQAPGILRTVGAPVDSNGLAAVPGPAAMPSPASSSQAYAGDSAAGGDRNALPAALQDGAKIVYTGELQLRVTDLDAALARGQSIVAALGGYVGGSQRQNDGDRSTATITYRIPADRWQQGVEQLRALGADVVSEQTQAVDVTGQVVDLAARIKNLQAEEAALQGIFARATKIPDVLEVQQQLSDVRGQIEELQAQQSQLTDQVSYGTLTTTYGLQVVAVQQAAQQWDPAQEVDGAAATLVDILRSVASAGIWFGIVWLPILVTLGVLALIAWFVIRRSGILNRRPASPPATTEA